MKVKDLIEQLKACDPEAKVALYLNMTEDGDGAGHVKEFQTVGDADDAFYFKGGTFTDIFSKYNGPLVVIC